MDLVLSKEIKWSLSIHRFLFLIFILFYLQAAVKYAAAQAQFKQHEQDVARLKLKHQLELKVRDKLLYH